MAPTAQQASAAANEGESTIGWKVERAQRRELLRQFPPFYSRVDADHVTLRTKVADDALLPDEILGEIVGRADDGKGVEAMVVAIAGTTDRPDGSVYHITWSLEPGREARESNDVLAGREWVAFDLPMPVRLKPSRWPWVDRQLYLDCDGVLADFESGASAVLGMHPKKFEKSHGLGRFWAKLANATDFYFGLPLLDGATLLFEAVKHLDPIILTGLPQGNWAADQKVRWAAKYFPGTRIITTMARDKRKHAKAGDVLVDDQTRHAHLWEEMGGTFIHHESVEETLERLGRYFEL